MTNNVFFIRVVDYMRNREKCNCGCTSFFKTTKNKYAHKIRCKQCNTVYIRNYKNHKFEIQNK